MAAGGDERQALQPFPHPPLVLAQQDASQLGEPVGWVVEDGQDCDFAAWSIAAGVQLFYLSRIMGTSVTQIDATYGHLVPDSEE